MSCKSLQSPGDRMKKVIRWVCEELKEHPEKKRETLYREAELRFDLSPLECEFLNAHFAREGNETTC